MPETTCTSSNRGSKTLIMFTVVGWVNRILLIHRGQIAQLKGRCCFHFNTSVMVCLAQFLLNVVPPFAMVLVVAETQDMQSSHEAC
ncbi:unnamed protein product [Hymenolepis diminuta]|uniref:G_PROTEIN_RECEP_F1_2 domain-containing protein n=1 Tax=Hymenolepis diminuta TaxID=6216 RepID=A0A0R3SN35_HYMDI|nr:unnamed protein product [Hymenolepis diminuta]